jgi:hypothetical protein
MVGACGGCIGWEAGGCLELEDLFLKLLGPLPEIFDKEGN